MDFRRNTGSAPLQERHELSQLHFHHFFSFTAWMIGKPTIEAALDASVCRQSDESLEELHQEVQAQEHQRDQHGMSSTLR